MLPDNLNSWRDPAGPSLPNGKDMTFPENPSGNLQKDVMEALEQGNPDAALEMIKQGKGEEGSGLIGKLLTKFGDLIRFKFTTDKGESHRKERMEKSEGNAEGDKSGKTSKTESTKPAGNLKMSEEDIKKEIERLNQSEKTEQGKKADVKDPAKKGDVKTQKTNTVAQAKSNEVNPLQAAETLESTQGFNQNDKFGKTVNAKEAELLELAKFIESQEMPAVPLVNPKTVFLGVDISGLMAFLTASNAQFSKAMRGMATGFQKGMEMLKSLASYLPPMNTVVSHLQTASSKALETLKKIYEPIADKAGELAEALKKVIAPAVENAFIFLKETAETIKEKIKKVVEPIAEKIAEVMKPIAEYGKKISHTVTEATSHIAHHTSKVADYTLNIFTPIVIPIVTQIGNIAAVSVQFSLKTLGYSLRAAKKVYQKTKETLHFAFELVRRAVGGIISETGKKARLLAEKLTSWILRLLLLLWMFLLKMVASLKKIASLITHIISNKILRPIKNQFSFFYRKLFG